MNRRVLITGLCGFTGRYLQQEFESSGWQVFGMGVRPVPENQNYRVVDLNDSSAMRNWIAEVQPRAVVHMAGLAFVGHSNANDFYQVNLIGTRNLLAAIADAAPRVTSILLASSANVYGNTCEGVLDESFQTTPANDYAVSKLAMEHMARLWFGKLPIVIARPFNYTGVGQSESFLIPKIVAHFRQRADHIELGNLDVWRDFMDVRALAQAYRRLVEFQVRDITVNICSGNTHSLREILSIASSISNHAMDVRVNPAYVRSNEVRSLCGNPDLLRSLVGDWETPPLVDTISWMLKN